MREENVLIRYALASGVSTGGALAITISWSVNHSILWAMFHGFARVNRLGYFITEIPWTNENTEVSLT